MSMRFQSVVMCAALAALALTLSSCAFKHRKYDNPIVQDTDQPDKILFDKAVDDIEHGRYEIARVELSTLMNTYETSEYMAKAKLAVADAWFREGGARGFGQAEAEYKDFILFYPNMEEASESQFKICDIHYRQMEKPDRDPKQALAAEHECRQLLVQFPNSTYADNAEQRLRNIQEVIAESEFRVGDFYRKRGSFNAAANRLGGVADQYPLFSRADEALWGEAQSYRRLGPVFRAQEGDSLVRIVRDYPLSEFADLAKARLDELEIPLPQADEQALARAQYNLEHLEEPGLFHKAFGFMRRGPDTWQASQMGTPQMELPTPTVPPLVPRPGGGLAGFQGEVTATPVTDTSALDNNPDARPAQQQPANAQPANGPPAPPAPAKP